MEEMQQMQHHQTMQRYLDKRKNTNDLEGRYHHSTAENGRSERVHNWRGITLLSIPGKIMAKVMLNHMRLAVDERLRQEQAGFRPGQSCCELIFTLRQIIEKTVKHETPILINFVDFKKAFDSIHRESL